MRFGIAEFLLSVTPSISGCQGPVGERGPLPEPRADPDAARPLPSLRLEDQFGNEVDLCAFRGQTVLLVIGDRTATDACRSWDRRLGEAMPGFAPHLRILDLPRLPLVLRPIAVSRVRREMMPPDTPLFIDWDGAAAAYYGAPPGAPTVIAVAPDGTILAREAGAVEPERLARILAALGRKIGG